MSFKTGFYANVEGFLEGSGCYDTWQRHAATKNKDSHVDFAKFTPDKYLLSWCTAVAGVEVENDGHTIVVPHGKWVNDNGNCVAAGTRILSESGYLPVESVSPRDVWTEYGTKKCGGVKYSGEKPTLHIATNWGTHLRMTHDHRVKVVSQSGNIEWKYGKEVQEGDLLLMRREAGDLLPESRGADPSLWEMIGRWYGDGCYSANGKSYCWLVPESEIENLETLRGWLHEIGYRQEKTPSQGGRAHDYVREKCYTLYPQQHERDGVKGEVVWCLTTQVFEMDRLIPPYKKRGNWRNNGVPEELWRAGRQQIAAFLRGLFTTDGGVIDPSSKRGGQISLATKRRGLAKDVKRLLNLLGIVSAITPGARWGKTGQNFDRIKVIRRYNVVLRGGLSKKRYQEQIGFSLQRKMEALAKIRNRKNKTEYMGYPYAKEKIERLFPKGSPLGGEAMSSVGATVRSIRRGWVNTLTEAKASDVLCLARRLDRDSDTCQELENYFEHEWYTEKVTRVTDGGLRHVYDVVNSESESYVTEGVVSHNCWQNDVLLETYKTFIYAENYLEHMQHKQLSKGKILDAVAWAVTKQAPGYPEPIPTVFVDCLVATDKRKHPKLVADIKAGRFDALSMGCNITHSQCSKCGEMFEESDDQCDCLEYHIGEWYRDNQGKRRRIAELCGIPGKPESNTFIELSWVAKPAFVPALKHGHLKQGKTWEGTPLRAIVPHERLKEAADES